MLFLSDVLQIKNKRLYIAVGLCVISFNVLTVYLFGSFWLKFPFSFLSGAIKKKCYRKLISII